jgi:site-specific DNA recombinase
MAEMRAVVYSRFSSTNQREASIEDQVRQCKAFLAGKGWTFIRAYEDRAMSGASAFRPAYQQMREDARAGLFDVAVAVSLDRFSRDQEDTAGLYKRLKHLGIPIVTVAEGEVTPLHVAFTGAMNSMALTLLAEKTWTGLEGRVLQGCSGGGISYGYRIDETRNGKDGDAYRAGKGDRGYRVIDPEQAAVVERIFRDYASGLAPRAIAFALNKEGVAGPRASAWAQSTINGNRQRGTGIVNNEQYVGRLVWNRLEYRKDPDTGKRVSRLNPESEWRIVDVPELRIIPQQLWEAAKARQRALDVKLEGMRSPEKNRRSGISATRRPQHLLSGLIRCGACGGGMFLVGGTSYGCSAARNKGTCTNRRTIKRRELEAMVIDGLKEQLMTPEAVKEFVSEFHREMNRVNAERRSHADVMRRELERLEREIQAIIDAVKRGAFSAALQRELTNLENRHSELTARAGEPPPPVTIHPNASEIYRRKVADLAQALAKPNIRSEAAEALRDLIEQVRVTPEQDGNSVELVGELAAMLNASGSKASVPFQEAARSGLSVAGARNQRCLHARIPRIAPLSRQLAASL